MIIYHQHEYDCSDSSSSPIIGDAKPINSTAPRLLLSQRLRVVRSPRRPRQGLVHTGPQGAPLGPVALEADGHRSLLMTSMTSYNNLIERKCSTLRQESVKIEGTRIRYWMFVRFRSWEPWNIQHQKTSGPTWDPDILQSFDHSWWWWWPESRASPDNPKNSASVGYLYRLDTPKKLPGFKLTKLHKKTCPKTIHETIDPKKVELYNHGKHTLNH